MWQCTFRHTDQNCPSRGTVIGCASEAVQGRVCGEEFGRRDGGDLVGQLDPVSGAMDHDEVVEFQVGDGPRKADRGRCSWERSGALGGFYPGVCKTSALGQVAVGHSGLEAGHDSLHGIQEVLGWIASAVGVLATLEFGRRFGGCDVLAGGRWSTDVAWRNPGDHAGDQSRRQRAELSRAAAPRTASMMRPWWWASSSSPASLAMKKPSVSAIVRCPSDATAESSRSGNVSR